MDHDWRIESAFGCEYLSHLSSHFPDTDKEMINAAKKFMFMAMRSYVTALKHSLPLRPRPLIGTGLTESESQPGGSTESESQPGSTSPPPPLGKFLLYEFLEGANALVLQPETRKQLRESFEATKLPPQALMTQLHESVWEMIGVDPSYGMAQLGRVSTDHQGDSTVMMKMQQFAVCQQFVGRESMMSERERKAFYDQVPPLMQAMPHMFILQRQQMMMRAGGGAGAGGPGGHVHGPNCQHGHDHGHGHGHEGSRGTNPSQEDIRRVSASLLSPPLILPSLLSPTAHSDDERRGLSPGHGAPGLSHPVKPRPGGGEDGALVIL
jgi:hypothetical protein